MPSTRRHQPVCTNSWTYDALYRLTNEVITSTGSISYRYDDVGNRTNRASSVSGISNVAYTNNANDQLLSETNGATIITYQYDGNGSLTSKTNITAHTGYIYSYDARNRLNGVTVGGITTRYVYNHDGIRVRSTTGSNPTQYSLIDPNNPTGYAQVLEEGTVQGATLAVQRSYVIGDDVISQSDLGSPSSYLLYDGHGSTRQLSQTGNTIAEQYNYDAYGIAVSGVPSSPATKLLYAGEQFDVNLQQYYLRARYYDPSNGRFNQLDTFMGNNDDPQSLHKYLYCGAEPVNGVDPSGKSTLIEVLFVVSIVVLVPTYFLVRNYWYRPRNARGRAEMFLFKARHILVDGLQFGYNETANGQGPENAVQHALGAIFAVRAPVGQRFGGFPTPEDALQALQSRETGADLDSQMDYANNYSGYLLAIKSGKPGQLLSSLSLKLTWVEYDPSVGHEVLVRKPLPPDLRNSLGTDLDSVLEEDHQY